jgi:signal transduction histidine kinase
MRDGQVLVLEPNTRLRVSRTRALARQGYHVTGVSSIEQATKEANQQIYDLLVVRVEEPELLNMLLAQFPAEMSVLIVATKGVVAKAAECAGAGIHSFLVQPFNLNKFKDTVARTIDRTRMMEEGLRSKILTTLEQANRLFTSEDEIDQILRLVVEMSAAETDADYVSLAVKNEATGKFSIRVQKGNENRLWKKICHELMKAGEPILIDETSQNHSQLHNLMAEAGISSVLCVPLVIKGNVIGAINYIKTGERVGFNSGDMNLASILAWWSSMVIENSWLISKVQQQHCQVADLLHEISFAQQNERRRLAIEIHDGVAQWMVGASYDIKACSTLIAESRLGELEEELSKIGKTLQRSVKELRRAIANLRPPALQEVGLVTAICQAAESLNEEDIKCDTQIDGELPKLSFTEETTTYWIVQEILTNIRNHSKASDVNLRIQFHDDAVSVEVSDNGQGFNPDEVMNSTMPLQHIGLLGMQERAKLLGGYLRIDSNVGQGTVIHFSFPVSSRIAVVTKV